MSGADVTLRYAGLRPSRGRSFQAAVAARPAAYLLPDALQQQSDGRFPDLFDGLADAGYGRNQKIQIGIVVERHHGNIFGDPQTRFAYGFDRAEQDRIAQGEYRRGTVGTCHGELGLPVAVLQRECVAGL